MSKGPLRKLQAKRATLKNKKSRKLDLRSPFVWQGNVEDFLSELPKKKVFDLIVTSPPYNIGKSYERKKKSVSRYFLEQRRIIEELVSKLKETGSICWQVGNYVDGGEIFPLDLEFHKIFRKLGLKLRNRIVWQFGHGLHGTRRFSGRYEVILWYTKSDKYKFDLDAVRVASKYPGKRAYKGRNKGKYSSHPDGKNPEDVWSLPNVNGNHVEKTIHPCQFPVALVERLVLALSKKNDLVFDPFCGVASAGVAALHHGRRFVGCEKMAKYARIGVERLTRAMAKEERFRPHHQPIYDHTQSKLSIHPRLKTKSGKYA